MFDVDDDVEDFRSSLFHDEDDDDDDEVVVVVVVGWGGEEEEENIDEKNRSWLQNDNQALRASIESTLKTQIDLSRGGASFVPSNTDGLNQKLLADDDEDDDEDLGLDSGNEKLPPPPSPPSSSHLSPSLSILPFPFFLLPS